MEKIKFVIAVTQAEGNIAELCRRFGIPLSPVLAGEIIGLREEEEELFAVYCGRIFLGWLESRTRTFVRHDRAERWVRSRDAA